MIVRRIVSRVREHLSKPEISLIVGPRQCGKTTLMRLLQDELSKKGMKTLFFSLDNDGDRPYFESQKSLLDKIKLEVGGEKVYVFIDEIQRKENAGLFLKGIYDRGLGYKLIVSGSGSLELKEKIHESLAGRKRGFEMGTGEFFELVDFRTNYSYEKKINDFFKIDSGIAFNYLNEYLSFGGYPKVVLAETESEKQQVMAEIYESYLVKDISYLLKIKKMESLTALVRMLAAQAGGMVNVSELSSTLGLAMDTVNNYLWYLEKTFIVKKVTPFFRNLRKEITKTPIYYFCDLGMRNYAMRKFGKVDVNLVDGHLFENYVYLQLMNLKGEQSSVHYWRTQDKAEVDFVIDQGEVIIPVEVKLSWLESPKVTRSLRSFLDRYKPKKAYVVHLGGLMEEEIGETLVEFIPYYDLGTRIVDVGLK